MMRALLVLSMAMVCGCGSNGAPKDVQDPVSAEPAAPSQLVVGQDACQTDADCVAQECCHPRACVGRDKAPACEGTPCTLNCIGGTMDCGGRCLCHEGKCAAQMAPPIVRPQPPATPQG